MDELATRLADASAGGVFHLAVEPYQIEREARSAGLLTARMDIGHAHHKEEFIGYIAKALQFPEGFGQNWDALKDSLTDLSWLDEANKGVVLVFEKAKHFGAGHRHQFDEAVAVLKAAADTWRGDGRPFWAFIHGAEGWDSGLPKWPAK